METKDTSVGSTDITGRWALITGAGSGIGEAIALAYAKKGLNLILVGRRQSALEAVAEKCKSLSSTVQCEVVSCDLTDSQAVDKLSADVIDKHGGVEVLVNNAGMGGDGGGTALQGDPDVWDKMFSLNVSAPMRLTRRLAPAMVERGQGIIVNMGSIAGTEPMTESAAYAASKYAMRGWSLSTWAKLRHFNIKVMLINPAFVNTPMVVKCGAIPERMIQPDDIAQCALMPLTTSPGCVPREVTLHLTLSAFAPK